MENMDEQFFQEEQFWGATERAIQELETLMGFATVNPDMNKDEVQSLINHLKELMGVVSMKTYTYFFADGSKCQVDATTPEQAYSKVQTDWSQILEFYEDDPEIANRMIWDSESQQWIDPLET